MICWFWFVIYWLVTRLGCPVLRAERWDINGWNKQTNVPHLTGLLKHVNKIIDMWRSWNIDGTLHLLHIRAEQRTQNRIGHCSDIQYDISQRWTTRGRKWGTGKGTRGECEFPTRRQQYLESVKIARKLHSHSPLVRKREEEWGLGRHIKPPVKASQFYGDGWRGKG